MTTGSIGPGTVLAGRYRLDDLLSESEGARFWRATDTVLARSVAIHAVASDDRRAPDLMDAARLSATVVDSHLLRVLDCDDSGGITWVVNEWGDGVSLDLMLQHGTLPASRAAWLVREVAEAIAAGHAQGVAHGRLNPESVLVTNAGAVKLIGYVVDATLQPPRPPDPLYGELDAREADVIDLAGLLYAALTGRWPGVAPSSIPRAPREARRPLRPRQVRAGVPRTLDAICERVLHKEASQHAMPIETAQEIAAALADFVGDPALSAPVGPSNMFDEPTVSIRRDELGEAEGAAATAMAATALGVPTDPDAVTGAQPPASDPEAADEPVDQPVPDPLEDPEPDRAPDPVPDPEATQLAPAVPPEDLSEATQIHSEPLEGPDSLAPLQAPRVEDSPPPPPFEDLPERPLFASTERRVPPAAAAAAAAAEAARVAEAAASATGTGHEEFASSHTGTGLTNTSTGQHTGAGQGSDFWPFTDEDEDKNDVHTGNEGRAWLRIAIVVGVLLVLVVATVIAFNQGRQDATGSPKPAGDSSQPSQSTGADLKIAAVKDFDPEGDPPEENPQKTAAAIDGDPATAWTTSTYRGNPELGGLKSGVGLMVDLGADQQAASITVQFNGAPTSFEVYAAPNGVTDFPDALDQLDKVGAQAAAPERVTVKLDPAPKTRYLLVWLTKLPAASGGFRGEIAEITVRS